MAAKQQEANQKRGGKRNLKKRGGGVKACTQIRHTHLSHPLSQWGPEKGPTGFRDGRRLGESQEIAAARDVGGKEPGSAFHGAKHKKRGCFFRGQYATVRLASI